jgi:hypothetical protein
MEKNICIIDGKKKFALLMEKNICIIDGKKYLHY